MNDSAGGDDASTLPSSTPVLQEPAGASSREPSVQEPRRNPALQVGNAVPATEPRHPEGGPERFEVLGSLGRGGMGEVSLVRDRDIARTVAIKRLAPGADSLTAARFIEEVRTLGTLEHPNIAPVYDVGVDREGRAYFLMQHVRGETLAHVIARLKAGDPAALARFPVEARAQLIISVLRALSYAHARGLIHRDLKPANLMVGPNGEVSVLDWGIARWSATEPERRGGDEAPGERGEGLTVDGSLVGTPRYMSPEQARGGGSQVDARSDLYSLGVVFHELLYLRHYLGPRKDLADVLAGVQEVTYRGPRERLYDATLPPIPVEFEWFLRRALQKDPAARFSSAEEMLADLERTARGDFLVECYVTFIKVIQRRLNRGLDRRPFLVPLALALASAVLAGCCVYTLLHVVR